MSETLSDNAVIENYLVETHSLGHRTANLRAGLP